MSFFIRNSSKKLHKKVNNNRALKLNQNSIGPPKKKFKNADSSKLKFEDITDDDNDEEILSDENTLQSDQDSEEDTAVSAQERKVTLAKKYLEEIEREEKERLDKEFDNEAVISRLRDDVLEQAGRLKKIVSDKLTGSSEECTYILRCKEHSRPITCIVISSDNKFIYSSSKDACIVKWSLQGKSKVCHILSKHKEKDIKRKENAHDSVVLSLAVSYDNRFLASGDESNLIKVWNPDSLEHIHTFKGHRGAVTGLAFCRETSHLYSCSEDRSVKIWNLDEMSYIETLFGHQSKVTGIDVLSKDKAVTSGSTDNTLRVWKVQEESQLIYNGHHRSIDMVKRLDSHHFVSCGDDGLLCVWGILKKKPLCIVSNAHGVSFNTEPQWISSIATISNSDVFASGSSDGFIRVWKNENFQTIEQMFTVPVTGFVNSMAFTSDENYLIAGVGQEHRFGRWLKVKEAKNCIMVIKLEKKQDR